MYIYIDVYIYMYIYVYIYICIYICIYIYIHILVVWILILVLSYSRLLGISCIYMWIHNCMCIDKYMHTLVSSPITVVGLGKFSALTMSKWPDSLPDTGTDTPCPLPNCMFFSAQLPVYDVYLRC
jgi:hypothetical protein